MGRAKYVNFNRAGVKQFESMKLFLEHGIVGARMNTDGQLTAIKHVQWGWMPVERFWLMQRMKEFAKSDFFAKIIEGGYRLNAALLDSAGGKVLYVSAVATLIYAYATRDWTTLSWMLIGLLAPFGAVILIYFFAKNIAEAVGQVGNQVDQSLHWSSGQTTDGKPLGPQGKQLIHDKVSGAFGGSTLTDEDKKIIESGA